MTRNDTLGGLDNIGKKNDHIYINAEFIQRVYSTSLFNEFIQQLTEIQNIILCE